MGKLNSLICNLIGHKPFSKISVQDVPKPKSHLQSASMNTFVGNNGSVGNVQSLLNMQNAASSTLSTLTATTGYVNSVNSFSNSMISVNAAPFEVSLRLCSRCKSAYWKTTINEVTLCNANNIPELKELYDFKKRATWEENQRKENGVAAKLYKQYLMTLKLGYSEDSDE